MYILMKGTIILTEGYHLGLKLLERLSSSVFKVSHSGVIPHRHKNIGEMKMKNKSIILKIA